MSLNKYIGIPFVDGGRSFEECDCYGLLKLYYKNELNTELPEINISIKQTRLANLRFYQEVEEHWDEIKEPFEGCAVALKTHPDHRGMVTHFGVVVKANGKLQILHTFKGVKSHLVRLNDPRYNNVIEGFYKWRS